MYVFLSLSLSENGTKRMDLYFYELSKVSNFMLTFVKLLVSFPPKLT